MLGLGDPAVSHQVAGIELNLDFVLRFAHLHAAADPVQGDRVAVGVQSDVALDVHQARVEPVDFRNPDGQWLQVQPFHGEELARDGPEMFLVGGVDLVAPLARLLIQVFPTGEGASGQEVILDEREGPLHTRRTVGIADRMRHEVKAETLGEGGHFGHGNHLASGAAQHHHMGVVDHHAARGAREVTQSGGEKHLAVKTLKGRGALEKKHP